MAIGAKGSLRAVSGVPPPGADLAGTLDATLGFELLETGEESARGRVEVSDRVKQPFGIVHGGVYAALAESIASVATYRAVAGASSPRASRASSRTRAVGRLSTPDRSS